MIELTKEEKSVLADRIYKLVNELNRALRDAAERSIFSTTTAIPTSFDPGGNGQSTQFYKLQVHVYEHVDFPDSSKPKMEIRKSSEGDQQ
jgi:hypothetical protein